MVAAEVSVAITCAYELLMLMDPVSPKGLRNIVQWELERDFIPNFESLHEFPFQTGALYIPKLQV